MIAARLRAVKLMLEPWGILGRMVGIVDAGGLRSIREVESGLWW